MAKHCQLIIQPVDLSHPLMPDLGVADWPEDWPRS